MEYIIKASPDEDWYCLWYTGPDAPGDYGTRQRLDNRYTIHGDRWARADVHGTSLHGVGPYGWDCPGWMVREIFPEPRFLPRENLKALCLAYEMGDEETMLALTREYKND
jgi:hypothetical protein